MKYEKLVSTIEQMNKHFQNQAANAVNVSLTIRNYLIGLYIVEFEQNGEDRSVYGSGLLDNLAFKLKIKGLVSAELSRCRQFYFCYPQILGALSQEYKNIVPSNFLVTPSQDSISAIRPSLAGLSTEYSKSNFSLSAINLIGKLSYSHIVEFIKIQDPLKRAFYEVECIKGTWSV